MEFKNKDKIQLVKIRKSSKLAFDKIEDLINSKQGYYNDRSDRWKDSEKGNILKERIDFLEKVLDSLKTTIKNIESLLILLDIDLIRIMDDKIIGIIDS